MSPWQKPYAVPLVRVLSTPLEPAPFPGKPWDRAWKDRAAGPGFATGSKLCNNDRIAAESCGSFIRDARRRIEDPAVLCGRSDD